MGPKSGPKKVKPDSRASLFVALIRGPKTAPVLGPFREINKEKTLPRREKREEREEREGRREKNDKI